MYAEELKKNRKISSITINDIFYNLYILIRLQPKFQLTNSSFILYFKVMEQYKKKLQIKIHTDTLCTIV